MELVSLLYHLFTKMEVLFIFQSLQDRDYGLSILKFLQSCLMLFFLLNPLSSILLFSFADL